MKAPTTVDEWWENVSADWDNLCEIFGRFLPMHEPAPADLHSKISPTNPQVSKTAWQDIEVCRANKNWEKLHQYLYAAWESAPDKGWIHELQGWNTLCDLLSEEWVFHDEEEQSFIQM